jgi:hypothetical protein
MFRLIFKWSLSMIFINIAAITAFAMLMMMVGCLHGDFRSHTISVPRLSIQRQWAGGTIGRTLSFGTSPGQS